MEQQERQPSWYESNLVWGPVSLVLALILAAVSGMVGLLWLAWVVSWVTVWAGTQRISQPRCEPAYFVLGALIFGLILYGINVSFISRPSVRPHLAIESVSDPMSVIPQSGQPVQPKVSKFARIKVTNVGEKSIANVRVVVTKLNDADCRYQLAVASTDVLFVVSGSLPVVSVNLNPGEDQYFDAIVECNGRVCDRGVLAIPHIENGRRMFVAYVENNVTERVRVLTVRASGDGEKAVTKTFTVSPETEKILTLTPVSDG